MTSLNIETKTNGYKAEALQEMKATFERAVAKLFPEATVKHFYYGERLDMIDVIVSSGNYGSFNLSANRVSFNGHSCTHEIHEKFTQLTYNDELFNGKLLELGAN